MLRLVTSALDYAQNENTHNPSFIALFCHSGYRPKKGTPGKFIFLKRLAQLQKSDHQRKVEAKPKRFYAHRQSRQGVHCLARPQRPSMVSQYSHPQPVIAHGISHQTNCFAFGQSHYAQ